jgi:hypothetical protein
VGAWLGDVRQRQRNTVLQTPVQNEGRFWHNLVSARLNFIQLVGFALLISYYIRIGNLGTFGFLIFASIRMAPHEPGGWWHQMMLPLVYGWTRPYL